MVVPTNIVGIQYIDSFVEHLKKPQVKIQCEYMYIQALTVNSEIVANSAGIFILNVAANSSSIVGKVKLKSVITS